MWALSLVQQKGHEMKTKLKALVLTALALACGTAHAISDSEKLAINGNIPNAERINLGKTIQQGTRQVVSPIYDFAVHGGSSVAAITLPAKIPAGAIITNSYFRIITQATSSGSSPTIILGTSTTNNLVTSFNPLNAGPNSLMQSASGVPAGTFATFQRSKSTAYDVKMTIGTHPLTAGKIQFFIEYIVGDSSYL